MRIENDRGIYQGTKLGEELPELQRYGRVREDSRRDTLRLGAKIGGAIVAGAILGGAIGVVDAKCQIRNKRDKSKVIPTNARDNNVGMDTATSATFPPQPTNTLLEYLKLQQENLGLKSEQSGRIWRVIPTERTEIRVEVKAGINVRHFPSQEFGNKVGSGKEHPPVEYLVYNRKPVEGAITELVAEIDTESGEIVGMWAVKWSDGIPKFSATFHGGESLASIRTEDMVDAGQAPIKAGDYFRNLGLPLVLPKTRSEPESK